MGSEKAAREVLNPLAKPFNKMRYLTENYGVSFFIRRDGELCMYGDSEALARAQLGDTYEAAKRLAHGVIAELAHTEYGEGRDQTLESTSHDETSLETHGVTDNTNIRTLEERPTNGERGPGKINSRIGHTRLLPVGWMPSLTAWENARESDGIDLYAFVINEENVPIEEIKIPLGSEFNSFRESLLSLRERHGRRIRFQTYVSEVGPAEEERDR
jgi:hypothetical protein